MEHVFRKQLPLEIGTLDLQITFRFVPGEISGSSSSSGNPASKTLSSAHSNLATENQKRALMGMARRLGREIDLDHLSKREASNLIDKFGAELRGS